MLGDFSGEMSAVRAAMRNLQDLTHPHLALAVIAVYADITAETAPSERTAELTALVLNDGRAAAIDQARAQRALDKIRLRMSAWTLEQAATRGRILALDEVVRRILTIGSTGPLRG